MLRYLGLAGQFLAAIALGLWLGRTIDITFSFSFPWFTLLLPLAIIVGMLVKLVC